MEGAGLVTPLGGVSGDGMGAVATTTACAADAAADTLSVSSVIGAHACNREEHHGTTYICRQRFVFVLVRVCKGQLVMMKRLDQSSTHSSRSSVSLGATAVDPAPEMMQERSMLTSDLRSGGQSCILRPTRKS
jgi:hypothetical protein